MSEEDIVKKLQDIAAAHSNDKIVLTIGEDSESFEWMDERGIEWG